MKRRISYEEVYAIIKKNGPISFQDLGKLIQEQHDISSDNWWGFEHSTIAGYLSNLSKNGLVKNIAPANEGIRKTPPEKIWVATENHR